jgi:hypothetical protein
LRLALAQLGRRRIPARLRGIELGGADQSTRHQRRDTLVLALSTRSRLRAPSRAAWASAISSRRGPRSSSSRRRLARSAAASARACWACARASSWRASSVPGDRLALPGEDLEQDFPGLGHDLDPVSLERANRRAGRCRRRRRP